jgi:hypothetical protein
VNDKHNSVLPYFFKAIRLHGDVAEAWVSEKHAIATDGFHNDKMVKTLESNRDDDRRLLAG